MAAVRKRVVSSVGWSLLKWRSLWSSLPVPACWCGVSFV